jgi:hypothetical protein
MPLASLAMTLKNGRNMCKSSPPPQKEVPRKEEIRLCVLPVISFSLFSLRDSVIDPRAIRDTQNSRLRFGGKAILHSDGVDFSSGESFSLRLNDLIPQRELGKGNYGTVTHVVHRVTNAHMAMKQIKLELDTSKFNTIITELQVPNLSISPQSRLVC